MNNTVLIMGKNSFVATGLEGVLTNGGYEVDLFTRGEDNRSSNIVSGKTSRILENKFFLDQYDSIINFVVLKDLGIEENIKYIKDLLDFCLNHSVKQFIHFSSIMVYDYKTIKVEEFTSVESSIKTDKKGYGEIKIAVDEYLLSVKEKYSFEIILVRPGYVLDDSRSYPFVKKLPFGLNLIKGNRESIQPVVLQESVHKAVLQIISNNDNLPVYHFFSNTNQTKYQLATEKYGGIILIMPEFLFRKIPLMFTKIGIFPKSLYSRFDGMYIKTVFSSEKTENKLQIKF